MYGIPQHLKIDIRKPGQGWGDDLIDLCIKQGIEEIDIQDTLTYLGQWADELDRQDEAAKPSSSYSRTIVMSGGSQSRFSNLAPILLDAAWKRVITGDLRPGHYHPGLHGSGANTEWRYFAVVGRRPEGDTRAAN